MNESAALWTMICIFMLVVMWVQDRTLSAYRKRVNELVDTNTKLMVDNLRWRLTPIHGLIIIRIKTDKKVAFFAPGDPGHILLDPGEGDALNIDLSKKATESYFYLENEPWKHRPSVTESAPPATAGPKGFSS